MSKNISSLKLCEMKAIADAELEARVALIKKLYKKKQYAQVNELLPICYANDGAKPYIYTECSSDGIFTLLWMDNYGSSGVTLWHVDSFNVGKKSVVHNPTAIIAWLHNSFAIFDDKLTNHQCRYRKNMNNVYIAYFPESNQMIKIFDRIKDNNVSIDLETDRIQFTHVPYCLGDDWCDVSIDEYMALYRKVKAEFKNVALACENKLTEVV